MCSDANKLDISNNGTYAEIPCRNENQCVMKLGNFCSRSNRDKPICRGGGSCSFNGVASNINPTPGCNKNLNGNDKCPPGQECYPNGKCGPPQTCKAQNKKCDPNKKECCGYCHKHGFRTSYTCANEAFIGEICASGIPCEKDSTCLDGLKLCSKRVGGACDDREDICHPGTTCIHAELEFGANKGCF